MEKTLLLVDDDNSEWDLFREAISLIDPSIVYSSAENGKVALELLENNLNDLPQVIFLDINMPVMNGWNCLIKIKNDERLKYIPVIIYSTSSHQRDVDMAMENGAICFCVKPESFKMLEQIIKVVSDNLDGDLLGALKEHRGSIPNFRGIK